LTNDVLFGELQGNGDGGNGASKFFPSGIPTHLALPSSLIYFTLWLFSFFLEKAID
jgi:hypothetical protein